MADTEATDIAERRAAFIKARAVLTQMSGSSDPGQSLGDGSAFFADGASLALTTDEAALIKDCLDHTRNSKFARPPEGYPDKLPELFTLGKG